MVNNFTFVYIRREKSSVGADRQRSVSHDLGGGSGSVLPGEYLLESCDGYFI